MQKNKIIINLFVIAVIAFIVGLWGIDFGLNSRQSLSLSIFSLSILGTVFFWEFRLAFAFLGTSILLISKTIDIENLILSSSLDVILFLIGMMVLIALLKETGLFAWIITLILRVKNLNAKKFTLILSVVSALLSCAVGEVASIILMVAAILEICDYYEVEPMSFIMISVFATNIGSAGTVLGNPVGILIATKAGLTFEDFIIKAFPLMVLCLVVTTILIFRIFKKDIQSLDKKMKELGANEMLIRLISVPPEQRLKKALLIFGVELFFISMHHRLEILLGLEPNTILIAVPLMFAAFVMILKHESARKYIEEGVEWWTLLFFMLLFAQAGTLKYIGTTDFLAHKIAAFTGSNHNFLIGFIIWTSAIGSSVLDNVVLVAAFIPIIQSFQNINLGPLWWALLFGGCLGGNITVVGSTANIVAAGILEKERNVKISFLRWIGVGLLVGVVTVSVVWVCLMFLPAYQ
ncbi:MAG: SLC13 family permease [Candidatus Omnitrophica bacterium]|nr:SLC13 family permease [Candidatus Omnitrophota bacterium]MDD5355786.1 SLC13 family permease [Candidatus Omnitrophota bacterium]